LFYATSFRERLTDDKKYNLVETQAETDGHLGLVFLCLLDPVACGRFWLAKTCHGGQNSHAQSKTIRVHFPWEPDYRDTHIITKSPYPLLFDKNGHPLGYHGEPSHGS
jgi:hypothetical protein